MKKLGLKPIPVLSVVKQKQKIFLPLATRSLKMYRTPMPVQVDTLIFARIVVILCSKSTIGKMENASCALLPIALLL